MGFLTPVALGLDTDGVVLDEASGWFSTGGTTPVVGFLLKSAIGILPIQYNARSKLCSALEVQCPRGARF